MLGCTMVCDITASGDRLRPARPTRLGRNLPGDELARSLTGELVEIANEVRLIVVAAGVRDFRPSQAVRLPQPLHRVIEPHDARVGLRRHADVFTERRDEMALTALEIARQPRDARRPPGRAQDMGGPDDQLIRGARTEHAAENRFVEDVEALLPGSGF